LPALTLSFATRKILFICFALGREIIRLRRGKYEGFNDQQFTEKRPQKAPE
jgi:hypothetical protein